MLSQNLQIKSVIELSFFFNPHKVQHVHTQTLIAFHRVWNEKFPLKSGREHQRFVNINPFYIETPTYPQNFALKLQQIDNIVCFNVEIPNILSTSVVGNAN